MKEVTTSLDFNSAISGIRPEDGKYRDNDHDATVKPVRGLIMSRTDGITGMHIGRFGAQVKHFPEIISADSVCGAFQAAIDELVAKQALQQPTGINALIDRTGLFPLRGETTPTVTIEPGSVPKPSHLKMVIARFNTDIAPFTKDAKKWSELTAAIGEALANIDGARDYEIYRREVRLTVDSRIVSGEAVQAHMDKVLEDLRNKKTVFPFANRVAGGAHVTYHHFDVK